MWLRITVISARVEVLRRKQGAYSGIKVVCISICIGRDAPFGAKPPQAGSHKSLMYLFEAKELFCHKKCKFTFQGVDQTLRRPLTVLLFRNCCKRDCISKDNGQFQKAKLRLRRLFSLQPKVQHYSTPTSLRVTTEAGLVCISPYFADVKNDASAAFCIGRNRYQACR